MTDYYTTAVDLVNSFRSLWSGYEAVKKIQAALEEAESAGMVGAWRKHNEGNCTVASALRVSAEELTEKIEGDVPWDDDVQEFANDLVRRVLIELRRRAGLT